MITVAMGLLFSNTALADHYISVIEVVDKKLNLSLEGVSTQTTVKILDSRGSVLVEEKIVAYRQFTGTYNLESLPSGSYTLVIESADKKTWQPIAITGKEVIMDKSKRVEHYRAAFTRKGGTLNISLLNPSRSVVRVFMIDQTGRLCYQDAIRNQPVIEKAFNLKRFPRGQYTLVVDNGDEVFSRNINL